MYKPTIFLFGLILPLLLLAAVVGGVVALKTRITESFQHKSSQYRVYSQSQRTAMNVEMETKPRRERLASWQDNLSAETASSLRTHLDTITTRLPTGEFQETAFEPLSGNSGFGAASTQPSSQVRVGFRGTFRSVQKALLELETRMPQLHLQDMKVEPSDQSALLNFQITYTAWEHKK